MVAIGSTSSGRSPVLTYTPWSPAANAMNLSKDEILHGDASGPGAGLRIRGRDARDPKALIQGALRCPRS